MSTPSSIEPAKNSTFAMSWLSVAVASTTSTPSIDVYAPGAWAAGLVRETVGGVVSCGSQRLVGCWLQLGFAASAS